MLGPPRCCSAREGGEAPTGQTRPMGHTEGKAGWRGTREPDGGGLRLSGSVALADCGDLRPLLRNL